MHATLRLWQYLNYTSVFRLHAESFAITGASREGLDIMSLSPLSVGAGGSCMVFRIILYVQRAAVVTPT